MLINQQLEFLKKDLLRVYGIKLEILKYPDGIVLSKDINGKHYGIKKYFYEFSIFFCPFCKTKDIEHIQEIRIDGSQKYENIGFAVKDNERGFIYSKTNGKNYVMEIPVSVKFFCKYCRNEFIRPELEKKLAEQGSQKYQDIWETIQCTMELFLEDLSKIEELKEEQYIQKTQDIGCIYCGKYFDSRAEHRCQK